MGNSTTQELIAATMVQPPASHHEEDLREVQLADSILGPILRSKEKGEKPPMEETQHASRSTHQLMQLMDQL